VGDIELRELLSQLFYVPAEEKKELPFETALNVWLKEHYKENVSMNEAADAMGMSPFYFSRQVKVITGKNFSELFTNYRIDKAKQRLEATDIPVSEVGKAVGYPDQNYFAKVFKRQLGVTPSVYRQQFRNS